MLTQLLLQAAAATPDPLHSPPGLAAPHAAPARPASSKPLSGQLQAARAHIARLRAENERLMEWGNELRAAQHRQAAGLSNHTSAPTHAVPHQQHAGLQPAAAHLGPHWQQAGTQMGATMQQWQQARMQHAPALPPWQLNGQQAGYTASPGQQAGPSQQPAAQQWVPGMGMHGMHSSAEAGPHAGPAATTEHQAARLLQLLSQPAQPAQHAASGGSQAHMQPHHTPLPPKHGGHTQSQVSSLLPGCLT